MSADVAIVGAGITGLSTAFHLGERDAGRIVIYEREGIGAGASGVQPGGVRAQWSTRLSCVLARRSLEFYEQLDERLGPRVDPGWTACGYLFLAEAPETLERLSADVTVQNDAGVPSRLVNPGEAGGLVPGLRADEVLGGSWCGEDGYFDRPQAVVEAFAEAAVRAGATVERGEVARLEPVGKAWRLRFRDGASAEAGVVVLAAGADTPEVVRPLGIELPIEAEPRYLFYSEPLAERLLGPLVVALDRRFAAKQLADGRLLASDLSATGDPALERERWRARVRAAIAELLPRLELVPLPLLVGGTYDVTPDHQPLLGPLDDGLVVAAGLSGHGFMLAPEIGRGAASWVVGEDPGEDLAKLHPDRLSRGADIPERRVV